MKKSLQIVSLAVLVILLGSFTFAWFNNNLETAVTGENTIKIESEGVLQIGYAKSESGTELAYNSGDVAYGSSIQMNIGEGGFDDVTGNGLTMFAPIVETNENVYQITGYETAVADDAAVTTDNGGKYVTMDIYFRSDVPMDVYLLKTSGVAPLTDSGLGLVENKGYSNPTHSDFPDGLPNLNTNQSSYGLFSRNLIAGAVRVAFAEYTASGSGFTAPTIPSSMWVPNSKYQLFTLSGDYYDTFNMDGVKESAYKYAISETETRSVGRDSSGRILSELYRISGGSLIPITSVVYDSTTEKCVPAVTVSGTAYPAIWNGETFVSACYNEDCKGYARASYGESGFYGYSLSDDTLVRAVENGKYKRIRIVTGDGSTTVVEYGEPLDYENIKSLFVTDAGSYTGCYWFDDSDFTKLLDSGSYCTANAVAHTTRIGASDGACYGKARISIWVEGNDREADIALNGGEFSVNLSFYGVTS